MKNYPDIVDLDFLNILHYKGTFNKQFLTILKNWVSSLYPNSKPIDGESLS